MLKNKRFLSGILTGIFLLVISNITPVFASAADTGVSRLSGDNRYATSVAISKAGWTSASTVIIATGSGYADALAASSLSKSKGAPILLTQKSAMDSDTIAEIKRLKATQAYIIGGTGVIGTGVENQLKSLNISIIRIGGTNRYDTSKKIAEILGTNNGVIVATGLGFADALSIAPIASIKSMPILLSPKESLDPVVEDFIKGKNIPASYIVGGTGALSDNVFYKMPNKVRLSGDNRYLTNLKINNYFASSLSFDTVYLATGRDFPDALSGSALAAKNNAPIFLTDSNSISADLINFLKSKNVKHVVILGGTGAVSTSVENAVDGAVNGLTVHPSSVSINKSTDTLAVGGTDTLTATVYPSNAYNKAVTWSSSNTSVVSVDNTGRVTAKGAGTATITVSTQDGSKKASCIITVNKSAYGLGQTAVINDGIYGKYELTIDKVEAVSERNEYSDINPAEVYKITYTYKLLSPDYSTVGLFIDGFDSVFDSTGQSGQDYPDLITYFPEVLKITGTYCTAETFVSVMNKSDSLTLIYDFTDNYGNDGFIKFNVPTKENNITTPPEGNPSDVILPSTTYGLGQTATINDDIFGKYELTINKVESVSERNEYSDITPAEVYKITYTYKLLSPGSSTDGLYIDGFDSAFDSTGQSGQDYPDIITYYPQQLKVSGSYCTAETFVSVMHKTDKLILTYDYSTGIDEDFVTFVIQQ